MRREMIGGIVSLDPCPAVRCPKRIELVQRRANAVLGEAAIPPLYAEAEWSQVCQPAVVLTRIDTALADRRNLWLYGLPGTGKTYLAAALLRRELANGVTGRFVVVPDLLARIRRAYSDSGPGADEMLDAVETTPLLVLDDLGCERLTPWVLETFYRLFNSRYLNRRQTVLTTNLSHEDLVDRLGERIVSRILEACEVVTLRGPDRRLTPEAKW